MNDNDDPQDERQQRLRKLAHDVKSDLQVIAMGLDALRGLNGETERFDEMCAMIQRDGVDALKKNVSALLEMANEPWRE